MTPELKYLSPRRVCFIDAGQREVRPHDRPAVISHRQDDRPSKLLALSSDRSASTSKSTSRYMARVHIGRQQFAHAQTQVDRAD